MSASDNIKQTIWATVGAAVENRGTLENESPDLSTVRYSLGNEEQLFHFRWIEEDVMLLAATKLGILRNDHHLWPAIFMLGSYSGWLTGGGGLGWDQESGEAFLSRAFPIREAIFEEPSPALERLNAFCQSAESAKQWLNRINSISIDLDYGEFSQIEINETDKKVLEETFSLIKGEEVANPSISPIEAIAPPEDFVSFCKEAFSDLGLKGEFEPDEDLAFHFDMEEEFSLEVRWDSILGEVLITSALGKIPYSVLSEHCPEILDDCRFLRNTGFGFLFSTGNEVAPLALSFAVSMGAIRPDSVALANILGNFIQTSKEVSDALASLSDSISETPENVISAILDRI